MQSPSWAANWFAASQEIPRISRNPKVLYRTHKRPPPVSILGQPNPVHIPTSHILEIHPNIIHPYTTRSAQLSLSLRFPHQDPIHPLSSPIPRTVTNRIKQRQCRNKIRKIPTNESKYQWRWNLTGQKRDIINITPLSYSLSNITIHRFLFNDYEYMIWACFLLWSCKFRAQPVSIQCFFLFWSNATTCPCGLRGPPSRTWQQCNRLLRLGRPWGAVTLSRWCEWWYRRM